jgi:hypothetical protein
MSPALGRLFIDTIQGYLNPRMFCVLNLGTCGSNGINEMVSSSALNVYPNPATSDINLSITGTNTIQNVKVLDVTGKLVMQFNGLNVSEYKINRQNLSSGLYFVRIELSNKEAITKKIALD